MVLKALELVLRTVILEIARRPQETQFSLDQSYSTHIMKIYTIKT